MVGDGSSKPTGVTTQASAGVTAAGAAAITYADLLGLYHSLSVPYRRNASFVFGDAAVKAIRLLTGSVGQPLWQPALTRRGSRTRCSGSPSTSTRTWRPLRRSRPRRSRVCSATSRTTGSATSTASRSSGSNELYAANGQVGFRAYHRTDGALTNANAVKAYAHSAT
jgi:predicted phage gp36 major capsid-like protein